MSQSKRHAIHLLPESLNHSFMHLTGCFVLESFVFVDDNGRWILSGRVAIAFSSLGGKRLSYMGYRPLVSEGRCPFITPWSSTSMGICSQSPSARAKRTRLSILKQSARAFRFLVLFGRSVSLFSNNLRRSGAI